MPNVMPGVVRVQGLMGDDAPLIGNVRRATAKAAQVPSAAAALAASAAMAKLFVIPRCASPEDGNAVKFAMVRFAMISGLPQATLKAAFARHATGNTTASARISIA